MGGEVPGCFSALRGGLCTREYAAKLTREWAKVLGSSTEEANGPESGKGGRDGLGQRGEGEA